MHEVLYDVALLYLKGVGLRALHHLLREDISSEEAFCEPPATFLKRLSAEARVQLQSRKPIEQAKKALQGCEEGEIAVFPFRHTNYPGHLRQIPYAPYVLFAKGDTSLWQTGLVTLAGTRNLSPYGRFLIPKIMEPLQHDGVVLGGGIHHGTETEVFKHASSLGMPMVLVLSSSIDKPYPASHARYIRDLPPSHCVLTEYPPAFPMRPHNFLNRNRVLAGLSRLIVLVESDVKGGALHIARMGFEYNREVYALPGNIDCAHSKGCNNLIKQNVAQLFNDPQQLVEALQLTDAKGNGREGAPSVSVEMDADEQKLVHFLQEKRAPVHLEALCDYAKLPVEKVMAMLLQLEMNEVVESFPGSFYATK